MPKGRRIQRAIWSAEAHDKWCMKEAMRAKEEQRRQEQKQPEKHNTEEKGGS